MDEQTGAIVAKTIYEQVAELEAELASATRDQKETQRDLDALYEVARRDVEAHVADDVDRTVALPYTRERNSSHVGRPPFAP